MADRTTKPDHVVKHGGNDHHGGLTANDPKSGAPSDMEAALGQYISDANPYTRNRNPGDTNFMLNFSEKEAYDNTGWEFKGTPHRIAKAIKIPYCFRDEDGQVTTKFIFVGFEGSGGQ